MKTLVKNFLLSVTTHDVPQCERSEIDRLIGDIEEAKDKIDHAWNRFNNAAPEYVELSLLELQLAETHYSLLNKRYRIMFGESKVPFALDVSLSKSAF